MTTSEQINEIATALAKAQGEIQNVVKDAKNPHFKSDYATLDAVTDTVRPVFAKHGLAVVQIPAFRDGSVQLDVLITHSSGQWIKGEAGAPIQKADPQGVGSATTYLRRYSLAGIAAIAQTDDDGNAASQGNGKPAAVKAAVPEKPFNYDVWRDDLVAAADNGLDALAEVWKNESAAKYRAYFNAAEKAGSLDALKAKAKKATAA